MKERHVRVWRFTFCENVDVSFFDWQTIEGKRVMRHGSYDHATPSSVERLHDVLGLNDRWTRPENVKIVEADFTQGSGTFGSAISIEVQVKGLLN